MTCSPHFVTKSESRISQIVLTKHIRFFEKKNVKLVLIDQNIREYSGKSFLLFVKSGCEQLFNWKNIKNQTTYQ